MAQRDPVTNQTEGDHAAAGRVETRRREIRGWYEGSLAQDLIRRLAVLDFSNQIVLFGAGLLVSLLPLLILLSAFASQPVHDDISVGLGLDSSASRIVGHLFDRSQASLNSTTVTSLIFVVAGAVAVAGSLQQIYEKTFDQDHRGMRDLPRYFVWIVILCAVLPALSESGKALRSRPAGAVIIEAVIFAILVPFSWWTMHFLLRGRVPWRELFPSALATGLFFVGFGVFSRFYFSSTIISDNRTYGTIGAVFSIMTGLVAIGAVIILGAVAGAVWRDRHLRRGGIA